MSLLGLVSPRSTATIEPRSVDEFISAEQFVERLQFRIQEMERSLAFEERLEVSAFLPSGKAIAVETIGYENPALVILNGREQESGKPSTLLAHPSSVQLLVSVEPLPSGEDRKILLFTHEK